MDEEKEDGVVPAEEEIEGGQHSKEEKGTDEEAEVTPKEEIEGKGADDPKDERINALMSKWQSEESSHNKTKTELEDYKKQFGKIDAEQKVDESDDDLPESFKPEWKPETTEDIQKGMKEAAEYGARKALGTIERSSQARKDAENAVNDFVSEVKEADSEFDDKEFYKYANKHSFPLKSVQDLRSVYSSFYEMQIAIAGAGKTAILNKEKRETPVNKPGAGEGGNKGPDYDKIRNANSSEDLIHDHFHN